MKFRDINLLGIVMILFMLAELIAIIVFLSLL